MKRMGCYGEKNVKALGLHECAILRLFDLCWQWLSEEFTRIRIETSLVEKNNEATEEEE